MSREVLDDAYTEHRPNRLAKRTDRRELKMLRLLQAFEPANCAGPRTTSKLVSDAPEGWILR
eukprot:5135711-Alexandrium_andersonii.AAC.1